MSIKGAAVILGAVAVITTTVLLTKDAQTTENVGPETEMVPAHNDEKNALAVEKAESVVEDDNASSIVAAGDEKTPAGVSGNKVGGVLNDEMVSTPQGDERSEFYATPVEGQHVEQDVQPGEDNVDEPEAADPHMEIVASQDECCINQAILFELRSDVDVSRLEWSLNDKALSQADNSRKAMLIMSNPGSQKLKVTGVMKGGKIFEMEKVVQVHKTNADFKIRQEGSDLKLSAAHPFSKNQWFVDHVLVDNDKLSTTFTGDVNAPVTVIYIATDIYGCSDTSVQTAVIKSECDPKLGEIQNIFTPYVTDRKNDNFEIQLDRPVENYRLTIYNSNGVVVFDTDKQDSAWNGRPFNQGEILPVGWYTYNVVYGCNENVKTERGKVLLAQ